MSPLSCPLAVKQLQWGPVVIFIVGKWVSQDPCWEGRKISPGTSLDCCSRKRLPNKFIWVNNRSCACVPLTKIHCPFQTTLLHKPIFAGGRVTSCWQTKFFSRHDSFTALILEIQLKWMSSLSLTQAMAFRHILAAINYKVGAGEMPQWLRAHTALEEDLSVVPNTHNWGG